MFPFLEARDNFVSVGGADCPTVCFNMLFKVFLKILFPCNIKHPHYPSHQNSFHSQCRAAHEFSLDSLQETRKTQNRQNHEWLCSISVMQSMNGQKDQAHRFYISTILGCPT